MKLNNIVNKSSFCSVGCIAKKEDIESLESYILYNKNVISEFPQIICAHTKVDSVSNEDFEKYNSLWTKHFGLDKTTVISKPNRGHTFGSIYLDKTVISKSKELGFEWCWKSANDILLNKNIFDVDMRDGSFFYLQGHGITGMNTYHNGIVDHAVESFSEENYEHYFPQTNFYITNIKTDDLINSDKFDELYNKCISDSEYKINKIQTEYKYALAELVLRDFSWRNNLKLRHLIGKNSYRQLINVIMDYRIADSSHKNIFFTECGICHFHFQNESVIEI